MERIKKIKKEIENMSKYHQIEVLRLCKNNNDILINENNNGTFINLTEVNEIVLQKLEDYVSYVIEQKYELDLIEKKKNNLQNNFFNDSNTINNTVENNIIENNTIKNNTIKNNTIENNIIENNIIENNTIENNTIENNTMENNTIEK